MMQCASMVEVVNLERIIEYIFGYAIIAIQSNTSSRKSRRLCTSCWAHPDVVAHVISFLPLSVKLFSHIQRELRL